MKELVVYVGYLLLFVVITNLKPFNLVFNYFSKQINYTIFKKKNKKKY